MDKTKWISVLVATPEHEKDTWSEEVIALADNMMVFVAMYQHGIWTRPRAFVDSGAKKVVAWIEFPEFNDDQEYRMY